MTDLYHNCAQITRRLHTALLELEGACRGLQLDPLSGREWYESLTQKLLPQLLDNAFLVVAVVGGTNIGKSVIFNHLAGSRASGTSPLASGTKHPVCLVPEGFAEQHDLESVFQGFELRKWTSSEEALEESDEHRLYWQSSSTTPENLLVLDTPDIDSDAQINWERADRIRRSADVLIAVLTQQKYNDAAVKQFFRKAAAEDKAVIVVFNQCQLPEDEEFWPLWLETFFQKTHLTPELLYLAPNDRRAAEENRLPFFQRTWPADSPQAAPNESETERSLMHDLSQLHFAEIKVRTLRGSLKELLSAEEGVPNYLEEVKSRSADFRSAAEILSSHRLAEIHNWPPIPNNVLIAEIRRWWQSQRSGWSAKVHGFYNTLGTGLAWPFRYARDQIYGEQPHPLEVYRQREWETILETVTEVYERLQWISELGNDLLKPRLRALLSGSSRTELLRDLEAEYARVDLENDLKTTVATEMQTFQSESPQFYTFLKRLDQVGAAARPATSVVLFVTGFGPAGDAAAQLIADSAIQSIVHLAGDVTGGTVTAAVGETTLSRTTSSGMGYLEAKFRKLHATFAARRALWMAEILESHLLGPLPRELQNAARLPESSEFRNVVSILDELRQQMKIPQEKATA